MNDDLKVLRLSHSSRGTMRGCEQKFYFYKFFKQPKGIFDSYAAMVGKSLHSAWQDYLINRDPEHATFTLMTQFDLRLQGGKYEARTLEAAYSTLLALIDHADSDAEFSLAHININGVARPAVEVPFQINFLEHGKPFEVRPGLPVTYIGFVDAILFSQLSGRFRVRDLKTHRNWSNDLTPTYMFDEQCIPYALVLEQAVGNALNNFEIEYLAAYVDVSKANIVPYVFQKGPALIGDWAKGLYLDLMGLKTNLALEWFPRRSKHCVGWQNEVCRFYEVCQSRNPAYYKEYFTLGKDLEYQEDTFQPWFTMNLELAA